MPWGMVFPGAERVPTDEVWVREIAAGAGMNIEGMQTINLPRHPSHLYEAFFEGIFLWLVLWLLLRKRKPFKGFVVGCYVIGYGIVRFFIEYARQPDIGIDFPIKLLDIPNPGYVYLTPWNFTTGQILNILMIAVGIASLIIFKKLAAGRQIQKQQVRQNLKKLRKKIR